MTLLKVINILNKAKLDLEQLDQTDEVKQIVNNLTIELNNLCHSDHYKCHVCNGKGCFNCDYKGYQSPYKCAGCDTLIDHAELCDECGHLSYADEERNQQLMELHNMGFDHEWE
jgi:hypothetical protein